MYTHRYNSRHHRGNTSGSVLLTIIAVVFIGTLVYSLIT